MRQTRIDRRHLLKTLLTTLPKTAAAIALSLEHDALARTLTRRVDANSKIGVGLIGCGDLGRSGHHLGRVLGMPEIDVRALCDVDQGHLDDAARIVTEAGGKATTHIDYREVLDRPDIDAVINVTPDHWHALIAVQACQAGKDVYCEKPLSLTVTEGRAMADAARRYGRVFQVGTQQRSDHRFHWACDLVRNGRIGKLTKVTAVIGSAPTCGFEPPITPPKELHWDRWLGPAPYAAYTPRRCHYEFRWIYDYSGGKMTDWGAHHLDIAQWGIGVDETGGPVEVDGSGKFPSKGLYDVATDFNVLYRYENGVVLRCMSDGENGITFEGTNGKVFVSRSRIAADPVEILDNELGTGSVKLYESRDHHGNWVDCMHSRKRPIADVEIGHRSATVCHLGNISLRLGRKLKFDPKTERFVGDEDANRMLWRPMRAPYTL